MTAKKTTRKARNAQDAQLIFADKSLWKMINETKYSTPLAWDALYAIALRCLDIERVIRRLDRVEPDAVALGHRGGKKGGHARAKAMTAKQRSESARKAVNARWSKRKTKKERVE